MLLGRRASKKGLKRDLQQISGLSDRSWVNFRRTNAQGGITAFQTWCLVSSCFPNFSIPIFPPLLCGAGSSIPSLLPLPQVAPFSPNIPSGPLQNQSPGKRGEHPGRSQGIPKGFPGNPCSRAFSGSLRGHGEKIPPDEKLTSYSHCLFLFFFFSPKVP